MRRRRLLLAAVGIAAGGGAQAEATGEVEVVGAVRQPLRLGAATLAAYPAAQQVRASLSRRVGDAERVTQVRGVRLADVLEQAGLDERERFDWRKAVVLATATDAYRALFSWAELVNTEAGRMVLLVHERDGAPLDAREGPVALHALGDLRTGPRHVRQLARIEVRILRD